MAGGYYLFGCADGSSKWYGVPNLDREYKLASYGQLRRKLKVSVGADSLALAQQLKDLRNEERAYNFQFLCRLGHNTLGLFMQEMLRPTLTDEQKKQLDESIQ